MDVCLFRAFPDSFRKSMEVYTDQLLRCITPLLAESDRVFSWLPDDIHVRPLWRRYMDQYVRYQKLVGGVGCDVRHVVDHGYGHLVRSLPSDRTVVTFHDATVYRLASTPLSTRLALKYSLASIQRAARVIADSDVSKRDFLQLVDYPEKDVVVVYPGIDESFRPISDRESHRERLGLPNDYLLHVGHNLPYMNVNAVVRAFIRCEQRLGADLHLVKVGEPLNAAQRHLLEAAGLAKRVIDYGRVPFLDLPALYSCAAVVLYPVQYTGFGLPALEAMACGVPVICSDRGSLPEITGGFADYCDPDDDACLTDAVERLLSKPPGTRERRTRDAAAWAQTFSWHRTAKQVVRVYRDVVDA